jgi:Chitobiase/beta-hexosaminidase C-terminal domain/Abnormal spindle-like microcephaly-assoc'd, ASPM-SPD-2-Hydin
MNRFSYSSLLALVLALCGCGDIHVNSNTSPNSNAGTLTLSPAPGAYTTSQTVTLADTNSAATIFYTTDGSAPSTSSTAYTAPIPLQTSTTIRALAAVDGVSNATASGTYTISNSTTPPGSAPPAPPIFTPAAGTYTTAQSVSMTSATGGAAIYYTLDGSTPSSASTPYTGPITVSSPVTIRAIAVLAGLASAVTSSTYVFNGPPPPTFSPAPGNYTAPVSVTVSDTDANAAIYYTLDGSTPSGSSARYTTPIPISTSTSIRAIAIDATLTSQVVSGAYNLAALTLSPTALSFGAVSLNSSATDSLMLTSSGAAPLTVSSATISGSGFSLSGATFPQTLNPGKAMTLKVTYTPTTTGTSTGQIVIQSNAVNQAIVDVALSGQGQTGGAISVSPSSATVPVNGTQQFTATVTGLANTSVNWSVAGTGCSGTACGSISSSGLYTAPQLVPSTGAVTITATSVQNTTLSATATMTIRSTGAVYYLAPATLGGNDANSGSSAQSPWLTPNHSLNCGDEIIAVPGSYSNQNFYTGKWGTVNCPAGNNVAWLTCQIFDACKIYATTNQGMWVDQSYWGVQGWEISTSAGDQYGACFVAQPNWDNPVEIHHILFANDVANGCSQSGFSSANHGSVGVDYFAVIGNIAYDAVQGSETCTSGISIYQPVQSDSAAGTHLYVAGNFSFANLEPSQCNGTSPTDGEGIILDTLDGSQGGLPNPYSAQAVAENNILIGNGAKGIEVFNNAVGSAQAPIYITQNTSWGNLTDPNQNFLGCGEIDVNNAYNTQVTGNLIATAAADGCGSNPIYALAVAKGNASDQVSGNFAFGYNGYNTFVYDSGAFSYGANTLGTNPQFSNPSIPSAPSCSGAANVPACMASTVANFTPTATAAKGLGYQTPTANPAADSLFPQWLCNTNLPQGLVNLTCQ